MRINVVIKKEYYTTWSMSTVGGREKEKDTKQVRKWKERIGKRSYGGLGDKMERDDYYRPKWKEIRCPVLAVATLHNTVSSVAASSHVTRYTTVLVLWRRMMLSQAIRSKRLNISSRFYHRLIALSLLFSHNQTAFRSNGVAPGTINNCPWCCPQLGR